VNRRQKDVLIDCTIVIVVTVIAIVSMINFKDWVNRSEAMRAMQHLSQVVLRYRNENGSVPPQSYVDSIRENLEGHIRLGKLIYRAQWLDLESTPDEILAYSEKKYRSFIGKGFVVLRLDGTVEWLDKKKFQTILNQQQNPLEIQTLQE
jgi:type II secretory pathway pseudopilin PulG